MAGGLIRSVPSRSYAKKAKKSEIPSVEANPTLAGTESDLQGLEVNGTKYKIPEGTSVVANPTLAGSESKLSGLQVGDTKYKVDTVEANPILVGTEANLEGIDVNGTKYKVGGSSNHLYLHTVYFVFTSGDKILFSFFNNHSTVYNSFNDVVDALIEKGLTGTVGQHPILATGIAISSSTSYSVYGIGAYYRNNVQGYTSLTLLSTAPSTISVRDSFMSAETKYMIEQIY